jgi:hypothetical protein
MDLKQYFKKIREAEAALTEAYPLLVSLETPDGGKGGRVAEVSRPLAAKMLVEGRATLASQAQRQAYFEHQAALKSAADKAELGRRLQVAFVADSDWRGPE